MTNIRNFCIIAHIDHGKSTLADRLLEITGTVDKRHMKEQVLDSMDLERERGITIKLQPVRMEYSLDGQEYILNLIDTPGHVDFSYEVSRSLAAVEGAVLLIDATQGIQAQTLANLYLALDQNLSIIPVINKIDLPAADVPRVVSEVQKLLGFTEDEIVKISAKTGKNVEAVLSAVVKHVPPPEAADEKPARALIFDSYFDDYQGVIAYVRVVDGSIRRGDRVKFMANAKEAEVLEVGYFKPDRKKCERLVSGEIGYVVTGMKAVGDCRVGDTIAAPRVSEALSGYKEIKSMVFAGVFPKEGSAFEFLREGIEKLKLTDASLLYEPEHSPALGFGFRCGFLGLLHLEIFQERLKREFGLDLIITVPSVAYKVVKTNGENMTIRSPQELPDPSQIEHIEEPIMKVDIITPSKYVGNIMPFVAEKRGKYLTTEYVLEERAILHYELPLSSLLVDFYDILKSATSGYASLNYEFSHYQISDVIRLDILIAEEVVDALASIVYRDDAYYSGKRVVEKLKTVLPKQLFEVKLQAAIGSKVIAAARIPAMRKDVIAKLYGGDVTRKRKLLEKQKKGKKKMKEMGQGKVDIPPDVFLSVLKR